MENKPPPPQIFSSPGKIRQKNSKPRKSYAETCQTLEESRHHLSSRAKRDGQPQVVNPWNFAVALLPGGDPAGRKCSNFIPRTGGDGS
jgi:hypothetical protein